MKQSYFKRRFLTKPRKAEFDNGFKTKYFSEDPFFVTFSVYFDPNSPLLNPATNTLFESAERFFLNLDDDIKAGYVSELRQRMLELTRDYQYYLQAVSGLNSMYSKVVGGSEIEIEIKTLESLDLRITKIKELYNKVTYDYTNHRELLPKNLSEINLKIVVADGRKIASWINNKLVDITPSLDVMCFSLNKTKMVIDEGHAFLDEVSNAEMEMAANSIKFKGGYAKMDESRMGIGKLLNNEIESINSINQNVKDSSVEIDLLTEKTEDKTLFGKFVSNLGDRLENEKNLLVGRLESTIESTKNTILERAENVIEDLAYGVVRDVKGEISDRVLDVARQSGLTNASGGVFQTLDGADFYERLKSAVRSGDLEFEPNSDLGRKILFGGELDFKEKADLFKALLEKAISL